MTDRTVATTSLRCFVTQQDIANVALYPASPFGASDQQAGDQRRCGHADDDVTVSRIDKAGRTGQSPRRVTPPHRGASLLQGRAAMIALARPDVRPANPNFSSGPCAKRPGFTLDALNGALLGRSHRGSGAQGAVG